MSKKINYDKEDEYHNHIIENNDNSEDDTLNDDEDDYFNTTIYIIQKNILNFIENKSLPLCEYLDTNSIKNFINDNIEY
jgi:hypothetical protein